MHLPIKISPSKSRGRATHSQEVCSGTQFGLIRAWRVETSTRQAALGSLVLQAECSGARTDRALTIYHQSNGYHTLRLLVVLLCLLPEVESPCRGPRNFPHRDHLLAPIRLFGDCKLAHSRNNGSVLDGIGLVSGCLGIDG